MKRLVIIAGISGTTLLFLACVAGLMLAGLERMSAAPPSIQKIVRITPVAPLATAQHLPDVESVAQPTVAPTDPPQPVETSRLAAPPSTPTAGAQPPPAPPATGVIDALARLVIPKLGLDVPVLSAPMEGESWQVDHLGSAVGHLAGTALPGTGSNMVLAGHVTLESGQDGPFIHLAHLEAGDSIYIYQADRRIEYVIDGNQIVGREAIEVTYPSEAGMITLITCSRWDETQSRYLDRLVVQGYLLNN